MSGRTKIFTLCCLGLLVASAVPFITLFVPRAEGGGTPGDILLHVELMDRDFDKMTSDGAGPYVDGSALVGSVVARIIGPKRTQAGRFIMSVDNAGDPRGRSLNFLFNDLRNPCAACGWEKTTEVAADFGFTSSVATRYVEFDSWGSTEPNSAFLFNFLTMEIGRSYYVGMSIRFRVTKPVGTESNQYDLGYSGSVVEVIASGPAGGPPTSWIIRSVDPTDPRFLDCGGPLHYRDLVREYKATKSRGVGYTHECYGWFYIPFEMHLFR